MKFRIRKAVLLLAVVSLISALTGRFILPLLGFRPKPGILTFISGLAAATFTWQVITIAFALEANIRTERKLAERFPKNVREAEMIGVKTELDYIQMVRVLLSYVAVPYSIGVRPKLRAVAIPSLFRRSIYLFEEMFGRKPEGFESGEWIIICEREISRAFGKDIEDVPETEFESRLSESIMEFTRRKNAEAARDAGE